MALTNSRVDILEEYRGPRNQAQKEYYEVVIENPDEKRSNFFT